MDNDATEIMQELKDTLEIPSVCIKYLIALSMSNNI